MEPIEPFIFDSVNFEPNTRYHESLLHTFYREDYRFLNQILEEAIEESKVFKCTRNFYFIQNDFFNQSHFLALLIFLEKEIYQFECAEFDYNLRILIQRFYRENGYEYLTYLIDDIYEIIVKIKRPFISVRSADMKRFKRKEIKANLKQLVEDFLVERGEAQKTADILNELQDNEIELEASKLLSQLNKWSQTFVRLGNGMWALKVWIKSDGPKGSIREIVEGLLENRKEPIHVSEILNYFETFRPISETSLLSNIRVSENIHFVFFNCSFIGLQSKEYPEYWSNIPRFSVTKFKHIYLNDDFSYEEKMKELEKIGYPRIHCEYIISRSNNNLNE
jgi:DNA-directed RNA polymerase delta subunit